MASKSNIQFTIEFNDPCLDKEELEAQAQELIKQMRILDEVEKVERIFDTLPPPGSKSIGSALMGVLTAEVSIDNARQMLSFFGERLVNKAIELEVEAKGKKLKLKAGNKQDLESALAIAQKFIEG